MPTTSSHVSGYTKYYEHPWVDSVPIYFEITESAHNLAPGVPASTFVIGASNNPETAKRAAEATSKMLSQIEIEERDVALRAVWKPEIRYRAGGAAEESIYRKGELYLLWARAGSGGATRISNILCQVIAEGLYFRNNFKDRPQSFTHNMRGMVMSDRIGEAFDKALLRCRSDIEQRLPMVSLSTVAA